VRRALLILALLMLAAARPAEAQRFVSVVFHDVLDDPRDIGPDDIATQRLIYFLDWLKGDGWTSITLDDVDAARTGRRALPDKAILLTVDDGRESSYTRVFPLLLAYRMHAVFALVGSWVDAPIGAIVRYGDVDAPRSEFLTWEQAREMQDSGLAEFASHSYDLHRGTPGNPQGSRFPTAAAWEYDPVRQAWESDASLRARVRADLERSRALMQAHLGRPPRAIVWPYGRYSGPALQGARDAGYSFALTLEPAPSDASRPMEIARYFASQDPKLDTMARALRFADPDPPARRVACLEAGALAGEAALGHAIEDVRALGANIVVLGKDGADRAGLSFAAWQLRSRASVDLFLRLDPARQSPAEMADIVRAAPVDGVLIDHPGNLAAASPLRVASYRWTVAAARAAADPAVLDADGRRALAAWRAAVALRPDLQLALPAAAEPAGPAPSGPQPAHSGPALWPAPVADWLLTAPAPDGLAALAARLQARGWLAADVGPRLALRLPDGPALPAAMRAAQVRGATAFAACPTPLPADAAVRAAFSAASFPRRP